MSDTPIRLCQCGKPADHDSVCRPARTPTGLEADDIESVSPEFETLTSERARERYERRKRDFDSDRRGQRAGMGLLDLHRAAVARQAKISTVSAGNPEPSRAGTDRVGPPRQQQLDDDPIWREHWRVIRSRLERVHEKLDEAEGLGPTAVRTMLTEEKDREILSKGRGFTAQAVVDLLGQDIAGSAETVRRVRRKHGHSSRDGEPLPGETQR